MEAIKRCLEEFPYCYQRSALETLINNNQIYTAQKLASEFSYNLHDDELLDHIKKLREAMRTYEPLPIVQKIPKCDECNKKKNVKWIKEPLLDEIYNIQQWLWMCDDCYRESCESI